MAARSSRVLGGVAKNSLFQRLTEMSDEDVVEFGQELDKCYRAKVAIENDDSAVIFGDLHSKLVGGRTSKETIVMDSGCSRDIVAQAIVSDLSLKMRELEKPLHIVSTDGNTLDITGTVTLFMSSQATGEKKRMIKATVLRGG